MAGLKTRMRAILTTMRDLFEEDRLDLEDAMAIKEDLEDTWQTILDEAMEVSSVETEEYEHSDEDEMDEEAPPVNRNLEFKTPSKRSRPTEN